MRWSRGPGSGTGPLNAWGRSDGPGRRRGGPAPRSPPGTQTGTIAAWTPRRRPGTLPQPRPGGDVTRANPQHQPEPRWPLDRPPGAWPSASRSCSPAAPRRHPQPHRPAARPARSRTPRRRGGHRPGARDAGGNADPTRRARRSSRRGPDGQPAPEPTARPIEAGPASADRPGRCRRRGPRVRLPKGWVTLGPERWRRRAGHRRAARRAPSPAGVKDQLPALIAAGLKLWAFDTRRADLGDNVERRRAAGLDPVCGSR